MQTPNCIDKIIFPPYTEIGRDDCCGCEACLNACKNEAITIIKDEEGFNYPLFDMEKCIKCDACIHACPVVFSKHKCDSQLNNNTLIEAYGGYSKNHNTVKTSSSGGVFSELANFWFHTYNNDAYVVGAAYSSDFRKVNTIIINSISKLDIIKRSKYVQSNKGMIYRKIEDLLKTGKYVLFCGTPCEIAGCKTYLKKDYVNLLAVDLVCQGPTSEEVLSQYIDEMERKFQSKVIDVNMRKKEGIWIPQYINVKFKNGKEFQDLFYDTAIGYALHIMQRRSCYKCFFLGDKRHSDITIGDFHGAGIDKQYYNKAGISIVVANTSKGKKVLKDNTNLALYRVNYEEIAKTNIRLVDSWAPDKNSKMFRAQFIANGLFEAEKKVRQEKMYRRIIMKLPWKYKRIFITLRNCFDNKVRM